MSSHKSRAPAHQNTTAWKHNPNSRKTKKVSRRGAAGENSGATPWPRTTQACMHRRWCADFVAAQRRPLQALPRHHRVAQALSQGPSLVGARGLPQPHMPTRRPAPYHFATAVFNPLQYKPLTKPAKCVGCHKPAVKAAYHAMCSDCSREKNVCPKCLESKDIWGACAPCAHARAAAGVAAG